LKLSVLLIRNLTENKGNVLCQFGTAQCVKEKAQAEKNALTAKRKSMKQADSLPKQF
jgi:hypothetical protein